LHFLMILNRAATSFFLKTSKNSNLTFSLSLSSPVIKRAKSKMGKGISKLLNELDSLVNPLEGLTLEDADLEFASDLDIRNLVDWIQSGKAKKIMVLTGAGVSVAAGIPDFRTPGTGLYDNLQKYNLPHPQAVFDVGFYRSNPQPFVTLAKELWPGLTHSPTLTHSFLKMLSDKGLLLRLYSQNIDGLEYLAGIPDDKLVVSKCLVCVCVCVVFGKRHTF